MLRINATYEGELHCKVVHGPSNSIIETDAPVDNQGKGEKFSPTDLVAAALSSCILTTMAIALERDGISMKGASAETQKEMTTSPPRKIASLKTTVTVPIGFPVESRTKLENAAHACPVHRSLDPGINASIEFVYLGARE